MDGLNKLMWRVLKSFILADFKISHNSHLNNRTLAEVMRWLHATLAVIQRLPIEVVTMMEFMIVKPVTSVTL